MSMFESGFGGWGANQINASMGMGPGGAGTMYQAAMSPTALYGSGGFGGTVGQYAPYPMFGEATYGGGGGGGKAVSSYPQGGDPMTAASYYPSVGASGAWGGASGSWDGGTKSGGAYEPGTTYDSNTGLYSSPFSDRWSTQQSPSPSYTPPASSFTDRWNVPNTYQNSGLPRGIYDPNVWKGTPQPAAPPPNPWEMPTTFEGRWDYGLGGGTKSGGAYEPGTTYDSNTGRYSSPGGYDSYGALSGTPTPQSRPSQADMYYNPSSSFNDRWGTSSTSSRDAIANSLLRQQGYNETGWGGSNLYGYPGSGQVGSKGAYAPGTTYDSNTGRYNDPFTSYPYFGAQPSGQIQNRFPYGMSSVNAPNQQQIQGGQDEMQRLLDLIYGATSGSGGYPDQLQGKDIFGIVPGGG